MVNFPPVLPTGSGTFSVKRNPARRIANSAATTKRETVLNDRRYQSNRRFRRGEKQIMDRRHGMDRRRFSVDLSV